LGELQGFTVFTIAIAGWMFGYFYTRVRGTQA
jgi:hypothetical protein